MFSLVRAAAVLLLLTWVLWRAADWAMAPGFAGRGGLWDENDTPLAQAQKRFGPILLVKWWIKDPAGTWGDTQKLLDHWGPFETADRLRLIIVVLWGALCAVALIPRLRFPQPLAGPGHSGTPSGSEITAGRRLARAAACWLERATAGNGATASLWRRWRFALISLASIGIGFPHAFGFAIPSTLDPVQFHCALITLLVASACAACAFLCPNRPLAPKITVLALALLSLFCATEFTVEYCYSRFAPQM